MQPRADTPPACPPESLRFFIAWLQANDDAPQPAADLVVAALRRHLSDKAASIDIALRAPGHSGAQARRAHVHAHPHVPASPYEARAMLARLVHCLKADEPVPPGLQAWLAHAYERWQGEAGQGFDQCLGLTARGGLSAHSKLTGRDAKLRALMTGPGTDKDRIQAFRRRLQCHGRTPDAELARIEAEHGRIPRSYSQLALILRGRTLCSQIDSDWVGESDRNA